MLVLGVIVGGEATLLGLGPTLLATLAGLLGVFTACVLVPPVPLVLVFAGVDVVVVEVRKSRADKARLVGVVWEDDERGEMTDCRFEPAESVDVLLERLGLAVGVPLTAHKNH